MAQNLDMLLALRLLKMLVTPFKKTRAYQLGIIDAVGKPLKKSSDLRTSEERNNYTIIHRMMYKIKRLIERIPSENKHWISIAAALALIKEHKDSEIMPLDFEQQFFNKLNENLDEELLIVEKCMNKKSRTTFKQFVEEAPINNAAGPGIAGVQAGSETVVRKKLKVVRRKECSCD